MDNPVKVFGIRHLSAGSGHHVIEFLENAKPGIVLIEGASDASDWIKHITDSSTHPPIALLAYTEEIPVKTLLYPFAAYSPEYQAMLWASRNKIAVEFMDLPAGVFLALESREQESREINKSILHDSMYSEIVRLANEDDYESYWEHNFEHNLDFKSYSLSLMEFGRQIRELSDDSNREKAINIIRESFMRYKIQEAVKKGYDPCRIAVIAGAYHAPVLNLTEPFLLPDDFKLLPSIKTRITLMPYSYLKLSSKTGYGAGNSAPLYFENLWNCIKDNDPKRISSYYISRAAEYLRGEGIFRSTADVIEAVRLSNALAQLKGREIPVLKEIQDAAITCLGYGEAGTVAKAMAQIEVGTEIGSLKEGVSQTPLQNDFNEELKRLKLEKYKSSVAMNLDLDLRENRRVQNEELAFIDLSRSAFLNRLAVLNIGFAKKVTVKQENATWAESWILQWTPESEISLVESNLLGETIELASAFRFSMRLSACGTIGEASRVIREACECGLEHSMELARKTLQSLAVDSGAFIDTTQAASELSLVIQYGGIRRIETSPLKPLLVQLFLHGSLLACGACHCDNKSAGDVLSAVSLMNTIALKHHDLVDEEPWINELKKISGLDNLNPVLSGFACALLLERNLVTDQQLSCEVSRRLSPMIDADLGAGWFEGLALRNRFGLLSRISLWEQLSLYIDSLDEQPFKRALVFLRRTFSSFEPSQKRRIAENLGHVWGIDPGSASEFINRNLSEEEEKKVKELNDFDFGDV